MKENSRVTLLALFSLPVGLSLLFFVTIKPVQFGLLDPLIRMSLVLAAVLTLLIAVYPLASAFSKKPVTYLLTIGLPTLLPVVSYYYLMLQGDSARAVNATQLQSDLITDRSSNGIIEVGFSYPIYTPTLRIKNNDLHTRSVNIFLRMRDSNNENLLFRAVRADVPGSQLSVEATVKGMLSNNSGYLYSPVELPPGTAMTGRAVFIISNLDDGTTFTEALGRAYQASFELRDPDSGDLVDEFPLEFL